MQHSPSRCLPSPQSCGDNALNPNIGTALGGGDDASFATTLSFPVTFPDGTVTTDIEITTNGRVFPIGADTADFSPTVLEFTGDTTCFAAAWVDMTFNAGATSVPDQVYLNDTGVEAIITWSDARLFTGDTLFTIQMVLSASGDIDFVYDSRFNALDNLSLGAGDGVSGCSAGPAQADPGSTDLGGSPSSTIGTIYELFNTGSNPFDLVGLALDVTPNAGGYDFSTPCATNSSYGTGCPGDNDASTIYEEFDGTNIADLDGVNLLFTPNGVGGYIVTNGGTAAAPVAPIDLALGDDALSVGEILTTAIPVPGGGMTNIIQVDSNGRVFFTDQNNGSDFSPTLAEFLGDNASVNLWEDLNPGGGGMVTWEEIPTGAVVRWTGVPFFGGSGNVVDAQIELRVDGSILIAVTGFQNDTAAIVGVTQGGPGATDGGPLDLSMANGFSSGATANTPTLTALTTPVLGTTLDLQVGELSPNAISAFVLVGAFELITDLTGIGAPGCFFLNDQLGVRPLPIDPLTGLSTVASFPIPNNTALIGARLYTQGAALDLTSANNMFGVILTSGIESQISDQ